MLITYIHHSCFSIETEESVFLFDYYKGNIPNFAKEKPIYAFSSHSHQDHFNLTVFELSEKYPDVTYILSKDIKLKDLAQENYNIITIGKNEAITLNDSVKIETLRSTDEGVAFLVSQNEKTLYHAGDLNWWVWKDDTTSEYNNMTKNYKDEINKLINRKIDIAFLPLDPRQEELYHLGFDYFMQNTNTSLAFPMHFWLDYSIIEKFKNSEEASVYKDKIITISLEGQTFNLD